IMVSSSAVLDTFIETNAVGSQSKQLNIVGSAATGGGVVEFAAGFLAAQPNASNNLTKLFIMGGTWATNDSGNLPCESVSFAVLTGLTFTPDGNATWQVKGSAQNFGSRPLDFQMNAIIKTDADLTTNNVTITGTTARTMTKTGSGAWTIGGFTCASTAISTL